MLQQAFDRHELQRYVSSARSSLGAPELQDSLTKAANAIDGGADPQAALRGRLGDVTDALASSGGDTRADVPYLSRDPVHSLLQTALEEKLREEPLRDETPEHRGLLGTLVHTVESLLHPGRFGPEDPEWVIQVVKAMLERLAEGNHPFNPQPAMHEISDTARVVLVGDWGTGLPRARAVAGFMADEVAGALAAERQAHVVHLGDVYYSGAREEVDRRVLAPGLWPVTVEQARAGVSSWSLNGNHDMYSGGYGYFDRLLADERFTSQRSGDGRTTSYFRIVAPSWELIGLDTAWDPDVLAQGHVAVLEDPQAEFAVNAAAEAVAAGRKVVLLSHHQLISVYDTADVGSTLPRKLKPILDAEQVTAWFWGHEHRCMGYAADHGVRFPRCVGHGGVPVLMEHELGDPVPPPGLWEERAFLERDGDRWQRFGFAVLDFSADHIDVRYRNDLGAQTREETIA
jgi:Calcineurin-like phosphoesterase